MRYVEYGKTGMRVSILGFGCMRLPMKGNVVDRDKAIPLLRRAFELGINFYDTAIGYCGGDSQAALGEAVQPFRQKVYLSTKNHNHQAPPGEWRRHLENSLRFLRTDYIDIYNHHGINWSVFTEYLDPSKGGLTKEMLKAKEEGLVRHVGFSFHGPAEDLKKLADTGYFESVILQYNLLDQSNAEAMHYVREKGLGITVMGPVGGGRLGLPSEQIRELTGGAAQSTPEAALRFVWAHPAVSVALSGMENLEMLEENVAIAENREPFSPEQIDALNRLVEERKKKSGLYCTGCRYCMPACAVGVSIPEQLDLLNLAKIYGLVAVARERYGNPWHVRVKARECVNCRQCISKCPQKSDIPARMREVVSLLDPLAGTVAISSTMDTVHPDGGFSLRLRAQSLADVEHDIGVRVEGREGVRFKTSRIEVRALPPFGRRSVLLEGTHPPSQRHIDFAMEITYSGRQERIEKTYSYLILSKGLSDDWASGEWHEAAPRSEDFSSAAETATLHGVRFKLSYDESSLLLLADVRDDFLFPSRPEHKGQLVDSVELFLDGRSAERVGNPRYEDGVYQIALYPGTPGLVPAFYHVCNGRKDIVVEIASERTANGYRMKVSVPFSSFCVTPGIPRKIGFDLAVNTADAAGNRIAQYVWAGGKDNWENASNFREVWLV